MNQTPLIHLVDDDAGVRDSLALLIGTVGLRVMPWAHPQAFLDGFDREAGHQGDEQERQRHRRNGHRAQAAPDQTVAFAVGADHLSHKGRVKSLTLCRFRGPGARPE